MSHAMTHVFGLDFPALQVRDLDALLRNRTRSAEISREPAGMDSNQVTRVSAVVPPGRAT